MVGGGVFIIIQMKLWRGFELMEKPEKWFKVKFLKKSIYWIHALYDTNGMPLQEGLMKGEMHKYVYLWAGLSKDHGKCQKSDMFA